MLAIPGIINPHDRPDDMQQEWTLPDYTNIMAFFNMGTAPKWQYTARINFKIYFMELH